MKRQLRLMPLTVLMLSISGVMLVVPEAAFGDQTTVVAVDPKITVKAPGESFNVTITVTDVAELFAWEFNMTYSPSVLNITAVTEGPFLKQAGNTAYLEPSFNNETGWVAYGRSLLPFPETGASGTGILAYVTFKVETEGKTELRLVDTKLRSWNAGAGELVQIQHTSSDGLFQYPLLRDIAVSSVDCSSLSVKVGESVSVGVTVKNKGNVTEAFTVKLAYDSTDIDTQDVTDLEPDASTTVQFSWDTSNLAAGSYTLTATAVPVSGEISTADNVNSQVVVQVTPAFPTAIVLAAVVVVVAVVLVVGVFLIRRRRSGKKQ